jgi:hypothetical protein
MSPAPMNNLSVTAEEFTLALLDEGAAGVMVPVKTEIWSSAEEVEEAAYAMSLQFPRRLVLASAPTGEPIGWFRGGKREK